MSEYKGLFDESDDDDKGKKITPNKMKVKPDFDTCSEKGKKPNKKEYKISKFKVNLKKERKIPLIKHPSIFESPEFLEIKKEIINALSKIEVQKNVLEQIEAEQYFGKVEYKWVLTSVDKERLIHLATQMQFRISEKDNTNLNEKNDIKANINSLCIEGNKIAFYYIGVEDNGNCLGIPDNALIDSLAVICKIARSIKAEMKILEIFQGKEGKVAHLMVGYPLKDRQKVEIRAILLGDVGVGKSTLMGCLISGQKDNGSGLAKSYAIKANGPGLKQFDSNFVADKILGIDRNGNITNSSIFATAMTIEEIIENSQKIIRLIDVSGQEKFKKSYLRGLNSIYPDYALILIDAKQDISNMTKEHLLFSISLNIPLIFLITKIDEVDNKGLEKSISCIKIIIGLVSEKMKGKDLFVILKKDDLSLYSEKMNEMIPVILINNKTLEGHDLLIKLFNILPIKDIWKDYDKQPPLFRVTRFMTTKTQKFISEGVMYKGELTIKKKYAIGPYENGEYKLIEIASIHCMRTPVKSVVSGQICSLEIIFIDKNKNKSFYFNLYKKRSGMVVLDINSNIYSTYSFEVDIRCLGGETKIPKKYQPIINIQNIRQAVKFTSLIDTPTEEEKENPIKLSSEEDIKENFDNLTIQDDNKMQIDNKISLAKPKKGKNAKKVKSIIELSFIESRRVGIKFLYFPEYIEESMNFIISGHKLKASGVVTKVLDKIYPLIPNLN